MGKPKRHKLPHQWLKIAPLLNTPHPLVWKSWLFWLVFAQLASGFGAAHPLGAGDHTVLDRRRL